MSRLIASGHRSRSVRFAFWVLPTADDLRAGRPVAAPLLLGWAFALVGAAGLQPWLVAALAPHDPTAGRAVLGLLWLAALLAPALQLARASLVSGASWALLTLLGTPCAWRPILSLALYADVLVQSQSVFTAIYMSLAGSRSALGPAGMRIPWGLAGWLPDTLPPAALALAGHLTVFHLAWWLLMTAGLMQVGRVHRRQAMLAAGIVWAGATAMNVAHTFSFL